MTFNFAPWAIDGARAPAGLARLASYATGGGRSGVTTPVDLKVTALTVPGNGIRVATGGACILNGYLSNPDEAYVVSNPSSHIVPPELMPAPNPGTSHYLVCVVIGDPEFDQTGHPFMPSEPLDPVVALDFEYVRMVILPCTSSTKNFEQLGVTYPGYALARLEVPPNTSTITNAMITDLRDLAQSRQHSELIIGRQTNTNSIGTGTSPNSEWIYPFDFSPTVDIPAWATRMKVLATVTSLGNVGVTDGEIRLLVSEFGIAGPSETFDIDTASGRHTLMAVWDGDVSTFAGQNIALVISGRSLYNPAGYLLIDSRTQIVYDVRFSEDVI